MPRATDTGPTPIAPAHMQWPASVPTPRRGDDAGAVWPSGQEKSFLAADDQSTLALIERHPHDLGLGFRRHHHVFVEEIWCGYFLDAGKTDIG